MRETQEGRPVKDVALSRDGFKHLAMMARTTEGRDSSAHPKLGDSLLSS